MEQKCEAPQNEDDENKDGQRTDQISAAVLKEKFSRVAVPDDRQIEKKYHCGNDPNAGHGVFKIFPAQGDVGADEKRGKKPDLSVPTCCTSRVDILSNAIAATMSPIA